MIQIRKSEDRGLAKIDWLTSRHTFSFADYYDENHMNFSVLRVINEDWIEGGKGFDTHPHRDMEIISYVVEGALEHKDSMGNKTIIKPGEVQRMSAGTGVRHSEHNHLADKNTHLLQIWILPEEKGMKPSYDQKSFSKEFECSDLVLVASKTGRNGTVTIHQDVAMYAAKAQNAGEKAIKTFPHRHYWLQVIKGEVSADSSKLSPGDGAGITGIESLKLKWNKGAEFIFFDLP